MRLQRLLLRRLTSLVDVITRGVKSRAGSYVHGTGSLPLTGSTIGQLLEQRVEMTPDREAVVVCYQQKRLTFQQLLQQVNNARLFFRRISFYKLTD